MGLEPMISRTTIWRDNQLHHTHHTEPGGIRTLDLRLRRPLLYPAELLNQHFYGLAVQIYALIFLFQKK